MASGNEDELRDEKEGVNKMWEEAGHSDGLLLMLLELSLMVTDEDVLLFSFLLPPLLYLPLLGMISFFLDMMVMMVEMMMTSPSPMNSLPFALLLLS